jgi:hypothetical protein
MRSISGEQKHVITQMVAETLFQETQVVIITGKVGAIFIFNLQIEKEEGDLSRSQCSYSKASLWEKY